MYKQEKQTERSYAEILLVSNVFPFHVMESDMS